MSLSQNISELQSIVKDLLKRIDYLEQSNSDLRLEVKQLRSDNKELKACLNSNSSNSHRPPSSDGLKKKPALPKKKNKKQGGQKGHTGKTLKMVSAPDKIKPCIPQVCQCGQNLTKAPKHLESTRQVFDLPDPKLVVTQYEHYSCHCPNCGEKQFGDLPVGLSSNTQYGSGVRALVTMLNVDLKLPFNKIKTLFSDLFGYQLNESTAYSAINKCYSLLYQSEQQIKEAILEGPVNHFDETGIRVAGKTQWLPNASNELFTYLFVHPKRGKEALNSIQSILPDYQGRAVHDCWTSYFKFDKCSHALCGAHLLRELQALIDRESKWAKTMHQFLYKVYKQADYGQSSLRKEELTKVYKRFKAICRKADKEEPPPIKKARGRPAKSKGRNLMERMLKNIEAVFAFTKQDNIPFTNNLAERDLRHAKVKQRVASCFRTDNGAAIYARIISFISTLRKQQKKPNNNNLNIFKELKAVFDGNPIQFSFQ